MKITLEMLEENDAYKSDLKWFKENFPTGEADHEEILKKLSEQKTTTFYGIWLLRVFDLSGLVEIWHDNGQQYVKDNYKNGELHGLYESWYENGKRWEKSNWKNGELHGLRKRWYENGQLSEKLKYKDGELHGLCESWDKKGNLLKKSNWKNGVKI